MGTWAWGLALKPVVGVLIFLAVFGSAKVISWCIYRLMPDSRLRRYLFLTKTDASRGSEPPDSLLK
jgi:hypothetical protein